MPKLPLTYGSRARRTFDCIRVIGSQCVNFRLSALMEWHFKSIARKSSLSEAPFVAGGRVACLIFKDVEAGEMGRADVLPDEVDAFDLPGEILGRWTRVVKGPDEDGATVRETVASAGDFFLSLYQNAQTDAQEETDALKHLLALMLERKRVVRVLGQRQRSGTQRYLHVKTKQEIEVPIVEISPRLMLKIQDTLGDIIL
jgi:hypothetical protein